MAARASGESRRSTDAKQGSSSLPPFGEDEAAPLRELLQPPFPLAAGAALQFEDPAAGLKPVLIKQPVGQAHGVGAVFGVQPRPGGEVFPVGVLLFNLPVRV